MSKPSGTRLEWPRALRIVLGGSDRDVGRRDDLARGSRRGRGRRRGAGPAVRGRARARRPLRLRRASPPVHRLPGLAAHPARRTPRASGRGAALRVRPGRASRRWPAAPRCASTCRIPIATRSWRMADGAEIGVDIERLRPLSDMDALAERVFSAAERAALAAVPPDRRVEAFFAGWTRKEAYIKARGEGIAAAGRHRGGAEPRRHPPAHPGGRPARRAATLVAGST